MVTETPDFAADSVMVDFPLTGRSPFELKVLDSNQFVDVDSSLQLEDNHGHSPEGVPDPIKVGEVSEAQTLLIDDEFCFLGGYSANELVSIQSHKSNLNFVPHVTLINNLESSPHLVGTWLW